MSTPKVLNCSDIEITVNGTKIAHITDGQLSMTHEPRIIFSNDTAPWEEQEPGKLTWQITGTSLVQMYAGLSLASLFSIMINRTAVDIVAKIGDATTVEGKATLANITGGGSTEQNGTCNYTFNGHKFPTVDGEVPPTSSTAADILTFSLAAQTGDATIGDGTIAITVANGTTVTALVATFTTSSGVYAVKVATTSQVSGTTPNNFTSPVTYVVTAGDQETTKNWVVTVIIAEA